MPSKPLKIAIVGATGAVGCVALKLLEGRGHPADMLAPLASARSEGRKLPYLGGQFTVREARPELFDGVDVAFVSVSSAVSRQLQPELTKRGALMIDDGSAFRMRPDVPLVVPEVNGADVEWHRGIISVPNCTTTPLVMVLDALRKISPVRRVTVATYQAVSGTGAAAQHELTEQSKEVLAGQPARPAVYPHQIAFNVLPQVDDFEADGYTKEEHKMVNESRKILHDPGLPLSATCVRVPVQVAHSEAVHVEFARAVSPGEARDALSGYAGISVVDDPLNRVYPMPHQAAGQDDVFVGRVRKDLSHPNGLALWLSCDNLRKGAALNALQVLDEVVRRGALKPAAAVPSPDRVPSGRGSG